MSFDAIGRMIVTGGRTNKQTSIYGNGSNTDSWVKFAEMQTPRGYQSSVTGGVSAAGRRSDDDDAMCGVAVMYDASQGQILTAGGSKTYVHNDARKRTYIITLNDTNFNSTVTLFNAPDMGHPRIYHSAVVLPNGETMVVGGRTHGEIFKDGPEAVLEPEIYSPTANSWTRMASHSIARSYHSFALLLPDATVLAGGGGLCPSNCDFNHFDAQIFTPPYLITSSGGLATRPRIVKTSAPSVLAGGRLTLNTDSAIVNASLVRYGSATHGLNTDQRRIPLKPMSTGANQYDVIIPRNTGIVIPGYWMLFVINAQGVPSKAATVQIRLR
ncbi:hypothetical protein H2199_002432 [Coniosporium tulheliwenetii]|uniref:Uncharacterized protein n=1 Tax=Coniosporium tulheliwenetii TaxID=3383036 RepID=A0ACC2ZFL3_9PEZI|nr:hypothetical protein H2199_002432 [Cladosporium sp. JES 115]